MNIGLILPAKKNREHKLFPKLYQAMHSYILTTHSIEIYQIELMEGLNLLVCSTPLYNYGELIHISTRKKLKAKLDRIFEEGMAWPVLEHPDVKGIYGPHEFEYNEAILEVVVNRFVEVLMLIHGIGDFSSREISVTGGSAHLEYAIAKLITKVKSMNILLPEGIQEPFEAEEAFAETGIPVHITTDHEVLNRSAVWLRFPEDNESFDALPENFNGIIVDFGDMKIIDTKNKKIFNIVVEFSEKIKRKLGQSILSSWGEGVLEGAIIKVCANAWDINCTEASIKLGMKLSFKS